MSLETSLLITFRLLSFTMIIQAAEILILTRRSDFKNIWSYQNLSIDLESGLPLPKKILQKLFSLSSLQIITGAQIAAATITAFAPHALGVVILILTHLLICIRFRGNFNGGSDMMTFVVLTGALIAAAGAPKIGMIYIATHTLYSYFKAGIAKAKHKEWRNGQAIPTFLTRSLFPDIQLAGEKLKTQNLISKTLGWLTLLFELAAPTLLIFPTAATTYMALAIIFHLGIYYCFGLNRFFWIWLTTWPATLYSLSLLK